VALPGAYTHASIALWITGAHRTPLREEVVVHEDISLLVSLSSSFVSGESITVKKGFRVS
jgi:hypothetical protein